MKYRLALIEDDRLLQEAIRLALEQASYSVDIYSEPNEFLNRYQQGDVYDLIILDLLLPQHSGTEILSYLRMTEDTTPVLVISVKQDVLTKVKHLHLGADDFLSKPFNLDELLARVKALLRRSLGKRRLPSSLKIKINGFEVDLEARTCQSNLGPTMLSEKEIKLLEFFVQFPNQTHSRADILEEIWGMDIAPSPRTVDNFILKFRKLFEDDPKNPKIFLLVRGIGYRFQPPD